MHVCFLNTYHAVHMYKDVKVMDQAFKALRKELKQKRSMECRWSKGKGTHPDCEGCRFESHPVLIFFLLLKLLKEKIKFS